MLVHCLSLYIYSHGALWTVGVTLFALKQFGFRHTGLEENLSNMCPQFVDGSTPFFVGRDQL